MRFLFFLLVVAATSSLAWLRHHQNNAPGKSAVKPAVHLSDKKTLELIRLRQYAGAIESYAAQHDFNTDVCFLVDMKIPSGSNRFFVFDLKKDSIINAGLVTHGYGNSNSSSIGFSNVPGSNSSSLGIYKIGRAYNGKFGLAFKLHGLDKTNSNAFNRFVVLHAHQCVPATEVAPGTICMSQGCPTVSPAFLAVLKTYLDKAGKPVLLKIFY